MSFFPLTLSLEFEDLVFLNSSYFHRSTYAFIHFPRVFKRFLGVLWHNIKFTETKVCLEFFWNSKYCRKKWSLVYVCFRVSCTHFFSVIQNQMHSKSLSFPYICIGISPEIYLVQDGDWLHVHSSLFLTEKVLCMHLYSSCSSRNPWKSHLDICRMHCSYECHNQFLGLFFLSGQHFLHTF